MSGANSLHGRAWLHIALQDGFQGDSVQIEIDDREIYRKDGVKTKTQISFADSVELELPEGQATVVVKIPSRQATERISLHLKGRVYLGLSLTPAGQVRHKVSEIPFGYA